LRARLPAGPGGSVLLDDADGLSPDEAALLALTRNPRLRAERARHGLAEAELLTAGILPNPRLTASLSVPTTGRDANVLGYGVGLSWNVTPLVSRSARLRAGRAHSASVDLEIAWQEWQVALSAHLSALRVLFLERRVRLAHGIEGALQTRLGRARAAVEADALTGEDIARLERSAAEARMRALELERSLVLERAELARAVGYDARLQPTMDTSWSPAGEAGDLGAILDELPRRRLDLLALQRAERSGDEALRAAVLARFPAVEVGLRTGRDVDGRGAARLSLSIGLPFFDRNQDEVARARATRSELDAEYDARLASARTEVVRVFQSLELVAREETAATEAAEFAVRLASESASAASAGTLSADRAEELEVRSRQARLRRLEIEQSRAELLDALALASGRFD